MDEVETEYNNCPNKRRRFYRKRTGDEANSLDGTDDLTPQRNTTFVTHFTPEPALPDTRNSGDEARIGIASHVPRAEILRQRKAARRRKGGIEFSNASARMIPSATSTAVTIVEQDDTADKFVSVTNRFAPQTGQVGADVDKHMMAYIDSEIVKRRQDNDLSIYASNSHDLGALSLNGTSAEAGIQRQPAALGKLHEIDLGPDATLRNIARTEAAKRRLEGGEVEIEVETGKVRLRKDGKPWRTRRRRNSDDVKRDKLVEEVMRESRLEIYDEPDVELLNDDQAADDRIAEQFRREFMDAVQQRRQKPPTTTKPVKGAKVDDKPKGPKLGGSRSARAAMREQQEKATKK